MTKRQKGWRFRFLFAFGAHNAISSTKWTTNQYKTEIWGIWRRCGDDATSQSTDLSQSRFRWTQASTLRCPGQGRPSGGRSDRSNLIIVDARKRSGEPWNGNFRWVCRRQCMPVRCGWRDNFTGWRTARCQITWWVTWFDSAGGLIAM